MNGKIKLLAGSATLWIVAAGGQPTLAPAQQAAPQPGTAQQQETGEAPDNVKQLFATTCGWCHNDGGRAAAHGPKLMGTTRSDDYIRERIMLGKEGRMPAFSGVFTDVQVDAIIKYIRGLKEDNG
jgi:mono/diheme cytochrome c family protein